MSTDIKFLSTQDAHAVSEIEKICFSHPWSEATLVSEMKSEHAHFFGAYFDGILVGYIGGRTLFGETEIFNVAVLPEFRRNGIAKALVERFVEHARELGTENILLEVRTSNLTAINLYEKMGFVFYGIRKNYYKDPTENAILMHIAYDGTMEYEEDD